MPIIPPADAEKIREVLAKEMVGDVHVAVLSEPSGGLVLPGQAERPDRAFDGVAELMTDLAALSPKLKVKHIDVRRSPERLAEYHVGDAPAIVFEQEGRRNIRFFGFPGGYEFSNLLQTITMASKGVTGVPPDYLEQVVSLPDTLHLQVFVTPT